MKKTSGLILLFMFILGCSQGSIGPTTPIVLDEPFPSLSQPLPAKTPIYSVAGVDNKLAISFDAAWGSEYTRQILDILDQYKIKTTFFVVKFWVEANPEIAREIVNRGHEIGNHSATHPEMGNLGAEEIENEIMTTHETIFNLTGFEPRLFRPPYGHYTAKMLETIAQLGYYAVQWDVDSLDWKELGAEDIIQRVAKKARGGSIILFHNNARYITAALPQILEGFRQQNLEVVPISRLIYMENYTIDHEGKQHKGQ